MAAVVNLPSAFFMRDGERFVTTPLTIGPWNSGLQHGGPPAALLAGAVERCGPEADRFLVTRLTFEFLRPLPLGAFGVKAEVVDTSANVQRVQARLMLGDEEVLRVHALRIRRSQVPLPSPRCPRHSPLRGPAGLEPWSFPFFRDKVAYHAGVEVRIARGVWGKGPAAAWMRLRVPLVDGASTSCLETLVTLADASSDLCPVVDPKQYRFVNPDLSVYLDRDPVGEWYGVDARATADSVGVGLNHAVLHDRDGEVGRSLQSLLVAPREAVLPELGGEPADAGGH